MKFVADNPKDFHFYYDGCWIAKKISYDKYEVYNVIEKEEDDDMNIVSLRNIEDKPIEVPWEEVAENWVLTPPNIGMITLTHTCAYITRYPDRQYKKGYCTGSYSKYIPNDEVNMPVPPKDIPNSLFNNKLFKYEELRKEIMEGKRLGGALSRNYGIFMNRDFKNMLFLYKKKLIGKALRDRVVIIAPWKEYENSIRNQISIDVEIAK